MKRGTALAAAVLMAGLGLTACSAGGGSNGSASVDLTNQTWIVPQDWGAIDPTKVSATNTGSILLVLEPLVLVSADGGVTPNLATETNPDPTTFVYTLRNDAKFSDGNPVTIDDVKYSFDLHTAADSTSTLAGSFANVASIETSGTDTLTIKLTKPDVQFETVVGVVGIVEKSVREKLGDAAGAPDSQNVGSGPYMVTSFKPGSELDLTRNPNYWGPKPVADTLTLKVITDDSARLLAVQSGDVTGAFEIPAAQADTYGKTPGMKVISGVNPSIMLFNVNTSMAPWNDIHVRQAVSAAIDKAGIVNAVLKGQGAPAVAVVPADKAVEDLSQSDVTSLYSTLDTNPFNLDAAKADLAQSATPTGFDATVEYSAVETTSGLVAQAVADNLKQIGINLTVQSVPDSQYTDDVFFHHTAPASIVDFTTDSADPISLPNYLTNSDQTLAAGGYTNIAEYTSAAEDSDLNTYLSTPAADLTTRGKLLSSVLTRMSTDVPYIPIYNSDYLAVVKDGITFNGFDGMWWQRRWIDEVAAN